MRKAIYRGTGDAARALFANADVIHLATTSNEGRPILRTLNAVVVDGALAFHGAPAGEKMEGLGKVAVVSAERIVASIPSYFLDAERACPATTYYVSAQAHGTLAEVTDPTKKARILGALMGKYQPERGHVPIDAAHPLYAKAIRGLLVAEVSLEAVDGKEKLGQNRTPEERVRVLEHLWRRGAPADVEAIALIVRRFPDLPTPAFLRHAGEVRLQCALASDEHDDAVALLEDAYWLTDLPGSTIRKAIATSTATVGARDAQGNLVAFARAVSDHRIAWIYDVMIAPSHRGRGLGRRLMELLLDHPAVRAARGVRLSTRDAMDFYRPLNFVLTSELETNRPWRSIEMVRPQAEARP